MISGCGPGQLFGPTLTPTATATPTPLATPTPTSGIGVLVANEGWEITKTAEDTATELASKPSLPFSNRTSTPNAGFIFVVVDVTFRALDAQEEGFISTAVSLITEDGTEITSVGGGDDASFCVGCISMFQVAANQNVSKSFVCVVPEDDLSQGFKLKFQDVPPIPFSMN